MASLKATVAHQFKLSQRQCSLTSRWAGREAALKLPMVMHGAGATTYTGRLVMEPEEILNLVQALRKKLSGTNSLIISPRVTDTCAEL